MAASGDRGAIRRGRAFASPHRHGHGVPGVLSAGALAALLPAQEVRRPPRPAAGAATAPRGGRRGRRPQRRRRLVLVPGREGDRVGRRLVLGTVAAGRRDPARAARWRPRRSTSSRGPHPRASARRPSRRTAPTTTTTRRRSSYAATAGCSRCGRATASTTASSHACRCGRATPRPGATSGLRPEPLLTDELHQPPTASPGTRTHLQLLPGERGPLQAVCRLSDDDGETWRAGPIVVDVPSALKHRPYVKYASDGKGAIHLAYSEGHPRDFDNSLYHVASATGDPRLGRDPIAHSTTGSPAPERGTGFHRPSCPTWPGPPTWRSTQTGSPWLRSRSRRARRVFRRDREARIIATSSEGGTQRVGLESGEPDCLRGLTPVRGRR